MKLNPTSALLPVSLPQFNTIHPYVPSSQTNGYQSLINELEAHLCSITGYDKFSFQPNSGAQGEYAGLCAILAYLRDKGEGQRDVSATPTLRLRVHVHVYFIRVLCNTVYNVRSFLFESNVFSRFFVIK